MNKPLLNLNEAKALEACGWFSGPNGETCAREATMEMLSQHWQKPVPVCIGHAEAANEYGFSVRQRSENTRAPQPKAVEGETLSSLRTIIDQSTYIGYGNAVTVEIERLQRELSEAMAELDESRRLHRIQASNYTKLYEAILGEGCFVGDIDPLEVAARHRMESEQLTAANQRIESLEKVNQELVLEIGRLKEKLTTAFNKKVAQ